MLNMAITPGIILIPSDMIILKGRVAGYNNVVTLATKDMKFGVNKDINYVEPSEDVKTAGTQGGQNGHLDETPTTTQEVPNLKSLLPKADDTAYLLGSAITLGLLVARYVI